jgi:outer membrane protein assembly factor BamB
MKNNWRILIPSLLAAAVLLSGCTGTPTGTNWPAVGASEDVAYLSNSTNVFAVQLSNGTMLWKYPLENGREMFYAPAVAAGEDQVIVGDYTKTLYSINPKNGNTNWLFSQAGGRYVGSALVTDDTIYAPNTDFSVYALDLEGGLKWKFTTGQVIWAAPVADEVNVYVNSLDHFTYALDAADGALVWKYDLKGPTAGSPVLGEGVIYTGMLDKRLVALQADNGKFLWETATDEAIFGTPVYRDGKVYLADLAGNIYCVDGTSGAIDWRITPAGAIAASPALFEGGVVFTSQQGDVIAVDINGEVVWLRTITGELNAAPVVAGDLILVTAFQGDNLMTAFSFDGDQKWPFNPPKK